MKHHERDVRETAIGGRAPAGVLPPSVATRIGRAAASSLDVGACTVAVIVASAAYGPFFDGGTFMAPVTGAAVLGAGCGVAILHLRRPPGLAWAMSVVALLLYAVWVVYPDRTISGVPGPGAIGAVGDGVLRGAARMLSVAPPVPADAAFLIVPVTLAFGASVAATVLTRRGAALLPVLPPLLVLVAALVLSANSPGFQWQVTLAFLGCVLLIILVRATASNAGLPAASDPTTADPGEAPGSPPPNSARSFWHTTAGRLLFGLPVVAGVAGLAVTGTVLVPIADGAERFDPREVVEQPLVLEPRLNPLVDVRRQFLADIPSHVFTIRAEDGGAIPFDHIRVAALDTYTGIQWESTARFVRTGSTLPAGEPFTDPGRITVEITLGDGMPPPLLPEVGRPLRIEANEIAFDEFSGLLATGVTALEGYSYRLTADFPTSGIDPSAAVVAQGSDTDALRRLPELTGDPAAGLRALAEQLTAGIPEPYRQLEALAAHLRESVYSQHATPGHSFAALDRFLPAAPDTVDKHVTEEQTVAAFAIMARSLGYPTRVAVGYRLNPAAVIDGTYTVTTKEADAWAEVAFEGRGWVPFLVTGPRTGDPPAPPESSQGGGQGPIDEVQPGDQGPEVAVGNTLARTISWVLVLTVLIPLVLLLVSIATVTLIKQWRRSRRRSTGSAAGRVLGAWRESTNRLLEHGMPVSLAHTPHEIGDEATEKFGDEAGRPVRALAPIVSAALYAPVGPDEDAVTQAWDLESELHSSLDARQAPPARLLFWIDPRPLLGGRLRRHRSPNGNGGVR